MSDKDVDEGQQGKELVVAQSADEVLDAMFVEVRSHIAAGKEKLRLERIEQQIQLHYFEKARVALNRLWKECRNHTGHRKEAVYREKGEAYDNYRNQIIGYQCAFCTMPMDEKGHLIGDPSGGIRGVGQMLRKADKEAGIEWTP